MVPITPLRLVPIQRYRQLDKYLPINITLSNPILIYTLYLSLHILSQENMQTFFIPILYDANTKQANKLVSLIRIHLQGQSIIHWNGFL